MAVCFELTRLAPDRFGARALVDGPIDRPFAVAEDQVEIAVVVPVTHRDGRGRSDREGPHGSSSRRR